MHTLRRELQLLRDKILDDGDSDKALTLSLYLPTLEDMITVSRHYEGLIRALRLTLALIKDEALTTLDEAKDQQYRAVYIQSSKLLQAYDEDMYGQHPAATPQN